MSKVNPLINKRFEGTITIWVRIYPTSQTNYFQPKISLSDFWYILRFDSFVDQTDPDSDPTREQLAHKLIVGQRATWPKLHMVYGCLLPETDNFRYRIAFDWSNRLKEEGHHSCWKRSTNRTRAPKATYLMGLCLAGYIFPVSFILIIRAKWRLFRVTKLCHESLD